MTTTHQGRRLTEDEARDLLRDEAGLSEVAIEIWLLMNCSWPPGVTDVELRRMLKQRTRRRKVAPPGPLTSRRKRVYPAPVEMEEPTPPDEPEMG